MKNELSKDKKNVSRNFWGAWAFVQILLLTVLGLLFYMSVTKNFLTLVVLILLLLVLFASKFWYKPASMKYFEVYGGVNRFKKETKMFNNRTFAVTICLTIFITVCTSFWYFGHHRPTQKIQNAKPVMKYNTVTPLQPKTQDSNIPATITSSHSHKESTLDTDTPLNQEQSDLRENTENGRDISVSQSKDQGKKETEHKHLQSKEEQDASKKLKVEAEEALALAKQTQKESLELMREGMPIIVNHLNTLSQDEQREILQQVKTAMANQILQFPPELQLLKDENNILEEGWKMYLDMLAEHGYTLPRGFEQ